MAVLRFAAAAAAAHGAAAVREYVALAPNGASGGTPARFRWVELQYPENVSRTADVEMRPVTSPVDALGDWYDVDPPGGVMLTAKIYGGSLYALLNLNGTSGFGGCCADTLRIYPRRGGAPSDVALDPLVAAATNTSAAAATHTFDVTTLADGTVAALLNVLYPEPELGGAPCDAVVAVDVARGTLVRTAAGRASFRVWREAGTRSLAPADSRFKVQYYAAGNDSSEQWHGNGVMRFTDKSGAALLALTHRQDAEAVIVRDPFTYADGGRVLQRFGTPWGWTDAARTTQKRRYFGLDPSASAFNSGVHNVWYTRASPALGGAEGITLFINEQDGASQAFEFALALRDEGAAGLPADDTVFATSYVQARCSFVARAQGGARSLGDGVFIVASGVGNGVGMEVADAANRTKSYAYPNATAQMFPPGNRTTGVKLYDPFIRVVV